METVKEKKEIGKLIELLNEYNGKESYWLDTDSISGEKYINRGDGNQCFIKEHIISKKFGFIKWLVENDKIDKNKLDTDLRRIYIGYNIGYYEGLLMLLSISDTPIDDLCSYLS